jgi:hypothetical protein
MDDARDGKVLHLDDGLLLVIFLTSSFTHISLLGACHNLVILGSKVPHNYLSIQTSSKKNIRVIGMELKTGDF